MFCSSIIDFTYLIRSGGASYFNGYYSLMFLCMYEYESILFKSDFSASRAVYTIRKRGQILAVNWSQKR